jgi:hypothetical protein
VDALYDHRHGLEALPGGIRDGLGQAVIWLVTEGNQLSAEQQKGMLDRMTKFRRDVVGEIEQETHAWVSEFKSNLAQLEQQARNRLQPETGKGSGQS